MKYNRITKEFKILGATFNFEKPTLFRMLKSRTTIKRVGYCYVFPQRVHTWSSGVIIETMYYVLWWRIIVFNTEKFKGW